jgi:arylsulfatase
VPDGGNTPFHGEKGTTWEGGMRVPCLVRWPGVVKPGTIYNDIMSQEDWLPTLLHAAGIQGIVEKCKKGYQANEKDWKVHLDGYDFLPYFRGQAQQGPRDTIFYFGQGGELNAVRWNDWKVHFANIEGNIALGERVISNWPILVNLRLDPYEKMPHESEMYVRWYADNMWLFVPVQDKLKEFFSTIPQYPFQEGMNLNMGNINYNTLKAAQALKQLNTIIEKGGMPMN